MQRERILYQQCWFVQVHQNAMHHVVAALDLRKKTAFHVALPTMTMMEFVNVSRI